MPNGDHALRELHLGAKCRRKKRRGTAHSWPRPSVHRLSSGGSTGEKMAKGGLADLQDPRSSPGDMSGAQLGRQT